MSQGTSDMERKPQAFQLGIANIPKPHTHLDLAVGIVVELVLQPIVEHSDDA